MRCSLWGFNLYAPVRNLIPRLCFPTDLPSTVSFFAAIATMLTFKVDGVRCPSRPSWRMESTDPIPHLQASSSWQEHQLKNKCYFRIDYFIEGDTNMRHCIYHCCWQPSEFFLVPPKDHTLRFQNSGHEGKIVPWPWERSSYLRGMDQGGADTIRVSSENRIWLGQYGVTKITCTASSLILHIVGVMRLTGRNVYLHKSLGQLHSY